MKLLRILIILVLHGPWLSYAAKDVGASTPDTSHTISTDSSLFNGMDYYSGRLIKGFGFGLDQFLEEQIDGQQAIESTPFLYLPLFNNTSIKISNRTSMKKIDPTEMTIYASNPINSTTQINAQIRPMNGLQLYPQIAFNTSKRVYNSHLLGNLSIRDEALAQSIQLDGQYMNRQGNLNPHPDMLKWMHYTDELIPFLNPGQTMLSFQLFFKQDEYTGLSQKDDGFIDPQENALFSQRKYKTSWDESMVSARLDYGWSRNVKSGIRLLYKKFSSNLWDDYLGYDNRANQHIKDLQFEPKLTIAMNNFYSQNLFTYSQTIENSNIRSLLTKTDQRKTPLWNFYSALHWLRGVDAPSQRLVLADYNHIFGPRLAQGAYHATCEMTLSSEHIENKYHKIFETPALLNLFHPQLQSRSARWTLALGYGVTDYIGISIQSVVEREKSFKPFPGSTDSKWFSKQDWINTLTFDLTNFIYNEHLEKVYGWENLTSFDQYYTPLLHPGLFKGKFGFSFYSASKSDDYFDTIHTFNPIKNNRDHPFINNKLACLSNELDLGIWGHVQIHYAGEFYFYSSKARNFLDKEYELRLSLGWQLFAGLRVEIFQNSARFVNNWDTRFQYYFDPFTYAYDIDFNSYTKTINTWNIRIISLF
jgi:hypothetical protein